MTYFLDFDRTLFDSPTFERLFAQNPACADIRADIERFANAPRDQTLVGGEERRALWKEVEKRYHDGLLSFTEEELSPLLFPDARDFLTVHGRDVVIVTSGDPEFQKMKIEKSGAAAFVRGAEYLAEATLKGDAAPALAQAHPGPCVFADDLTEQLDSIAAALPGARCFEVRRDGELGSGRYPVICSFAELETIRS